MVRNRASSEVAEVPHRLGLEDQVVAVPRPAAQGRRRGVRVPLARIAGSAAQGDGAGGRRALLNDMAPDDRTMFLEELPAAATRSS
jgi:hypothetical protein